MKHWLIILGGLLLLAFICPGRGAAQISGKVRWQTNDRVLVNWSGDEYFYPATITKIADGRYYVVFDDGDEEWTTAERIVTENLRAGDVVYANWKRQGTYYPGRITARRGNNISIAYDDGDREDTTIAVVRVLLRSK